MTFAGAAGLSGIKILGGEIISRLKTEEEGRHAAWNMSRFPVRQAEKDEEITEYGGGRLDSFAIDSRALHFILAGNKMKWGCIR